MSKFAIFTGAFSAVLFAGAAAHANPTVHGPAGHASSHAPKARLTMAQARAIALRTAPGKLMSSEYEKEGGGWRYSFDIQQHNNVQEIGIDGQSGKIVENKSEGRHDRD